jgi:hypothetical protein
MSVCPSVGMGQLGSHWTDFHEIWHLIVFLNTVEKVLFSLKSDKNSGTLHEEQCTVLIISRSVLLGMRNVSGKFVEKIKTHILYSVQFFFKSCRLWDNVEKYCRVGQATDDSMAHAHCVLDNEGYKHALTICNTYCVTTKIMVARTRLYVTLQVLWLFGQTVVFIQTYPVGYDLSYIWL